MTIATAPRTIRDDGGAAAGDAIPAGPLTRRQLPFSVVAKPTGAACNLDCQYCFFLSKELLYATKRQQMNEAVSRPCAACHSSAPSSSCANAIAVPGSMSSTRCRPMAR